MAASGTSTWPKSKSSKNNSDKHRQVLGKRGSTGVVEVEDNISNSGREQQESSSYLHFPNYLSAMQGRGRFQVSSSDIRLQTSPLNIQHACRLQQQLMAEFPDEDDDRKVVLGICAMAKKSSSKPMNEIIQRLVDNFDRLQVLVFDEDTILNKPVEEWPIVNGLVSFFSSGFPLDKAIAYKNLRKVFIVNDLEMQYVLRDRRKVYAMMKENNIPHPRYAVLDRENDPDCQVIETEDSIEFNGNLFMKPFVEKPVDAEDHNIYIYFPQSAGGGSTRLFRKIKDRSSVYLRFCRVRSKGSYLYEDFMPTDGTDVKVYTVGPDYQHAEARKSPALDGKVERDKEGKEIRYPVLLANREKMIARNVCKVFKQNVCGFDLLRANGQHYVCDVNGFSFVKTSSKYYDDCAKILGTLVMRACCPQLHIPYPMSSAPEDIPVVQTTSGSMMELRSVIAVIRHGDRTPKQKMKMEVKNKKFFQLFEKYGGFPTGQLKLKKPKQLQEVLDIVRDLLAEGQSNADPEVEEKRNKLNQLKLVLEMYGHFSGINRKVQLKYQPKGRPKRSSSDEGIEKFVDIPHLGCSESQASTQSLDEAPRDPSLLLILKWGGELTTAGRIQAENLGKAFRTLYPGGQGQFEGAGLGFLRLHSTFRHDLKIYASDEGRVQMTAAAFTKGLLALEGQLTPILVQMVKSANTNGLLDGESVTSKYQMVVKEKLKDMFNEDREFTEEDHKKLAATNSMSLVNAMQFVKNPFKICCRVHEMIKEITTRIRCLKADLKSRNLTLFNGESWELLMRRWAKLEKDFLLKNGRYDISKIPDIYDCIKYDLHHNQATLQFERAQELFMCSKALADIVIPQEYGITSEERLHIGQNYCMPLMRKIRCDLLQCATESQDESATRLDSKYSKGVASPERFVRTRLYFTSESHIHSMLSMLRYGGFLDEENDEQWKRAMDFMGACAELNYMSQIVIMMFEDPAQDINSDDRFHVELHFSPGAYTSCDQVENKPKGMGFRPKLQRESTTETTSSCAVADNQDESQLITPEMEDQDASHLFPSSPSPSHAAPSLMTNIEEMLEKETSALNVSAEKLKSSESPSASAGAGSGKKSKFAHQPQSPDPDTPEWDWGDDDDDDDDKDDKDDHDGGDKKKGNNSDKSSNSKVVAEEKTEEEGGMKMDRISVHSSSSMPVNLESSSQGLPFSLPDSESSHWKNRRPVRQRSVPANCTCCGCSGGGAAAAAAAGSSVGGGGNTSGASNGDKLSGSLPKWVEVLLRREGNGNVPESLIEEEMVDSAVAKSATAASGNNAAMANSRQTTPIQIAVSTHTELMRQTSEDKRSRSLEDGCLNVSCKQGKNNQESSLRNLLIARNIIASVFQRNYKTIHLPLSRDLVFRPLSSFLFFNNTPKGSVSSRGLYPLASDMGLTVSASSPDFSHLGALFNKEAALEGFNNVPLLHPLETLHNNLTFHQVDDFLGRVTTQKFPIPDISALNTLANKVPLNAPIKVSDHIPPSISSNSSSGGPNSPTSATAPVDLLTTLGMYIGNCQQQSPEGDGGGGGGNTITNSNHDSQAGNNDQLSEETPREGGGS